MATSQPAALALPAASERVIPLSAPVETVDESAAPCARGGADLSSILMDPTCVVSDKEAATLLKSASPAPEVTVTIAAPSVPPGEWLDLHVTFRNGGTRPLALIFDGHERGTINLPGEPPDPHSKDIVLTFDTKASTLEGKSIEGRDLLGNALVGGNGRLRRLRVTLLAHQAVTTTVAWRAEGFLPGKSYAPPGWMQRAMLDVHPEPEPLPPGEYVVRVVTPLARPGTGAHFAEPSIHVTVAR